MNESSGSKMSSLSSLDALDLGSLVRILLMQSKLIALIVITSFSLWVLFYISAERTYQVESLLQIEDGSIDSQIGGYQTSGLVLGSSSRTDLDNHAILYETRTNLADLIKKLHLYVENKDLSEKGLVTFDELNFKDPSPIKEFKIIFLDGLFKVVDENQEVVISSAKIGALNTNDKIEIKIF